jgi:glyoxylate reductase
MAADKPVVFVTRKLPDAVEERLRREFRPRLNPDDRRYDADALIAQSAGAEAVLTCSTEPWPAAQIERLPDEVRAIATNWRRLPSGSTTRLGRRGTGGR